MNLGIGTPKVSAKNGGNGRAFVSPSIEEPDVVQKQIMRAFPVLWKIVGVIVFIAGTAACGWYSLVARVNVFEQRSAAVEQTAHTKEAAAGDRAVVIEQLKAISDRLTAIDHRLERIENKRNR